MVRLRPFVAAVLVSFAMPLSGAQQRDGSAITVDAAVDRIATSEAALRERLKTLHPFVEVYVQSLAGDRTVGSIPTRDDYFLGTFDGAARPSLTSLTLDSGAFHDSPKMTSVQYLPRGFAATTVPDWQSFDRSHYTFSFVRRESLGELRTLVFDVRPSAKHSSGFEGRIWVDDRDFAIVRFNGINRNVDLTMTTFFTMTSLHRKKLPFHIDSWRTNVAKGVWLPSYVYCEEVDLGGGEGAAPRIKSQMRLWGYQMKDAGAPPTIVDRLEQARLLAPAGPVDAVLDTVLKNLQVGAEVPLVGTVNARLLLTLPLDTFTVDHTIVISRGLVDVLPDEASLAAVLAHQLAHILLAQPPADPRLASPDRLSDGDLLSALRTPRSRTDESAADAKAMTLLTSSIYKDRLSSAGLFLHAIAANAKALPNLVQPHISSAVPPQQPERADRIAALPLGARLVVDPWTDQATLMRTDAVAAASPRETVPLAITSLMPYLRYAQ